MDFGIFIFLCFYLQVLIIVEEEDDFILLKYRKNRGKVIEFSESMVDIVVIKKFYVSFINF